MSDLALCFEDEDPEEPLLRRSDIGGVRTCRVISKTDGWNALHAGDIFRDLIWDRFCDVFIFVSAGIEDELTLTGKARLLSEASGQRLYFSEDLREGMLESMMALAAIVADKQQQQAKLDNLIYRLFEVLKKDRRNDIGDWNYIATIFPKLCEISPTVCMSFMEEEKKTPTGMLDMMGIKESEEFLSGDHRYTGILWGMEVLLCQSETFDRAFRWLVWLDDQGLTYTCSNSQKDLLAKALTPYFTMAGIPTADKKQQLAQMLLHEDRYGWDFLYHMVCRDSHIPTEPNLFYRKSVKWRLATESERAQVCSSYFQLLMENLGCDPGRFYKIIDLGEDLTEKVRELIEGRFQSVVISMTEEHRIVLYNRLCKKCHDLRFYRRQDEDNTQRDLTIDWILRLMEIIPFSKPVYRKAYLFMTDDSRGLILDPPSLEEKESWKVEAESLQQEQKELIQQCRDGEHGYDIQDLLYLCQHRNEQYNLATALGLYWSEDRSENMAMARKLAAQVPGGFMLLPFARPLLFRNDSMAADLINIARECGCDDQTIASLYWLDMEYCSDTEKSLIRLADEDILNLCMTHIDDHFCPAEKNWQWVLQTAKRKADGVNYIHLLFYSWQKGYLRTAALFPYLNGLQHMDFAQEKAGGLFPYEVQQLLKAMKPLTENDPQMQMTYSLFQIELRLVQYIGVEKLIYTKRMFQSNGRMYAQLVGTVQDNPARNTVGSFLYRRLFFCPAQNKDNVDQQALFQWIEDFRDQMARQGMEQFYGYLLGQRLGDGPKDKSDAPCEAVCAAMEKYGDCDVFRGYSDQILYPDRKHFHVMDGGEREKKQADQYAAIAERLSPKYLNMASIYRDLEKFFRNVADRERTRAEQGLL